MTSRNLPRLRVLATRPQPQNDALISALQAHGVDAVSCPLFALEAVTRSDQAYAVALLGNPDVIAIFVSPAAVRFGIALGTAPMAALAVAVGSGTADALRAQGVRQVLQPLSTSGLIGSEALLALPELEQLQDRVVVIVQGDHPRGLLQRELHSRGAAVVELTCYRRSETQISSNDFMDLCLQPKIDALIVSSLGTWRRIEQLTAGRTDELGFLTLIAISERVRTAIAAGVWQGPVRVSNGADASAILMVLEDSVRGC